MTSYDVDLFVIGAGSGGTRAARIAAGFGARVKVAEEYRVGGTCVIRGCVPKKLFVYAARFAHEFEDSAGFGWSLQGASFDWPTLVANKDKEIARLEGAYRANLGRADVEILPQRATVEGPNAVRLADGTRVSAKYILIATGGHPNLGPEIPGRELAITSNEAFHLPRLPRSIVIQGAGYIALEFACLFAGLGAKVTVVHRGAQLLRDFDDEVSEHLAAEMRASGIAIELGVTIAAIEPDAEGRRVRLSDGREIVADEVMLAIGRLPNIAGLGLETAGVALAANGAIKVDAGSRTNVPSIYAVGDVTDRLQLTPVAIREGHAFADTVFGAKPWTVDHSLVATAVFTEPEIGTVGLTEAQARAQGYRLDIYKADFRPMKATLSGRATRTFMKLVVDQQTDRVLGVHLIGEASAEMIQIVGIVLAMGGTKADFDRTIALHPSAAEELVTMRSKDPSSDGPESLPEQSAESTPAI
ncbi:glutathione-disulfide reductase [Ancylobacter defluvii]|uniref:Glutathione reductase n=1 Tax=Ancylobacter defluvii TaxID=1282440 RepID=A0A9W6NCV5_9HYPH|nr:glutathione-disulfide reductase [Ancylobacter defluvii]MBS7586676.1 glutathione-disulfide reductase [Ancylobacter defluvii]GLK85976.1 glutathione-disulfide reductase [Ancylobacter defluvii]